MPWTDMRLQPPVRTVMEHLYGYRMPNISVFVYVILRLVIRLLNESFDMYVIVLKKESYFCKIADSKVSVEPAD